MAVGKANSAAAGVDKSRSVVGLLKKTFPVEWRQQDCLDKIASKDDTKMRVFAFEDTTFKPGCRKFIVASIRDFFPWYMSKCPAQQRHFYELILERRPCRLYFDLEFQRPFNAEVDGPAMVQQFIEVVCASLAELLGLELDAQRDFLVMDSSNDQKFSAHVIVHVPGEKEINKENGEADNRNVENRPTAEANPRERLFPPDNTDAVKRIVFSICSQLLREKRCQVRTGANEWTSFCDSSVYSRNRNFRLFLSSKCGRAEVFQLADYCNFYKVRSIDHPQPAQIFADSLVIPVNYTELPLLQMGPKVPDLNSLKATLDAYKRGLDPAATVNVLTTLQQQQQQKSANPMAVDKPNNGNDQQPQQQQPPKGGGVVELARGSGYTPFHMLDQYMMAVFQRFNLKTKVRTWCIICCNVRTTMTREDGTEEEASKKVYQLQYQLTGNHFCMNRGREHKRQNIYWMVNLSEFYFAQRCFDTVDCPKYVSPAFAFPDKLITDLHSTIPSIFQHFGIAPPQLPLLDDVLAKRNKAASDTLAKHFEWSEKYADGPFGCLQLLTPMEELAAAEEELAGSRTFVEDVDENDDPITDIDLVNLPDVLAKPRLSSSAEESVHLIAEGSAQPSKRQRPKSPEQQQPGCSHSAATAPLDNEQIGQAFSDFPPHQLDPDFLLKQHQLLAEIAHGPASTCKDYKNLIQFRVRLIIAKLLPLEMMLDGVPQEIADKVQSYFVGLKWSLSPMAGEGDSGDDEECREEEDNKNDGT